MSETLKPCKRCGMEGKLETFKYPIGKGWSYVMCSGWHHGCCRSSDNCPTTAEAVADWNKINLAEVKP